MNNGTALNQSKRWLGFLIVVVPCLWGLFFWLRDWTLAVIAAFTSLYLERSGGHGARTEGRRTKGVRCR